MGRKSDPKKKEFAYILYMAGELQKDIAERVEISPLTLINWIKDGGWAEKRAAKNITRTEIVNKTLMAISDLLDRASEEKDEEKLSGLSDKLSKLASTIEKLDKQNSVVDDIETFMNFGHWLQRRVNVDKNLTLDMVKLINKYQDIFISERLARQ
jgi:hypothetical protein